MYLNELLVKVYCSVLNADRNIRKFVIDKACKEQIIDNTLSCSNYILESSQCLYTLPVKSNKDRLSCKKVHFKVLSVSMYPWCVVQVS